MSSVRVDKTIIRRNVGMARVITGRGTVLLLGPSRSAVSGASTHINLLLCSTLAEQFNLVHFEIGSQGKESPARDEPLGAMLWRVMWSPFALAGRLVTVKPSIVHINTSLVPKSFWRDLIYLLVAKLFHTKVVYQLHGGSIKTFRANARLSSQIFNWVIQLPDAVVVINTVERDSYIASTQAKRLVMIPNAIDLNEYAGTRPKEYAARPIRFVYIGRLDLDKGLMEAVDAMSLLVRQRMIEDVEFVIAGSGPAELALRSRVEALGLAQHVAFIGSVFGVDKTKFWQNADILVFPSYHEGLPYTVLESLATGTPVVASAVGGIPDAVEDGIHGVLIKPRDVGLLADVLESLINDRERLRWMSAACLARARRLYGINRLAREFGELYEDVMM